MVLGAVLRCGHLEDVGHALERLLRVPIGHHLRRFRKKKMMKRYFQIDGQVACHLFLKKKAFKYLQDGKVFEDTVHHVLFGQVFELVDKVDHVLAHGRPMDAVDETAVLEARVFRLHFLDDLFAERAHFGRTRNSHVLIALVPFFKVFN